MLTDAQYGGQSRAAALSARAERALYNVTRFGGSKTSSPDAALGDDIGRSATDATMLTFVH
jgi:hypothetical protein